MQPSASSFGTGPRRFVASAARVQHMGAIVALVSVLLVAGIGGLNWLLPKAVAGVVVSIAIVLFIAGYGAFLVVALRGKKVTLDVYGDRVVIDEGRGGVFPLAGAALGAWSAPSLGVISGSVLHLSDGAHRLRIGGQDHRATGRRLDAPIVTTTDMFVSAADFEAILALVPTAAAAPAGRTEIRCDLLPNPAAARTAIATIAPWFATIAIVSVVNIGLAQTGLFDSSSGQYVALGINVPIIVGGLVLTMVRSMRKAPSLAIVIDFRELRLCEPKTGRVIEAMPLGSIAVMRGRSRTSGRMTFEYPTLTIRAPSGRDVSFGVYDMRFGWIDPTANVSSPRYIVGQPDWNVLTDVLGLRAFVVMNEAYNG